MHYDFTRGRVFASNILLYSHLLHNDMYTDVNFFPCTTRQNISRSKIQRECFRRVIDVKFPSALRIHTLCLYCSLVAIIVHPLRRSAATTKIYYACARRFLICPVLFTECRDTMKRFLDPSTLKKNTVFFDLPFKTRWWSPISFCVIHSLAHSSAFHNRKMLFTISNANSRLIYSTSNAVGPIDRSCHENPNYYLKYFNYFNYFLR